MFSNRFESQTLRFSTVRLRGSQFLHDLSQHFTAPCHHRRFTVVIHLSSFVEDSENTEPCRLYGVKNCYNDSFWRFVDTQPIVRPRFRTHFADIPNSQLMYSVKLLMIKGGLTLMLSFPKACFLSRICRSNFRCFLHRAF